MPTIGEIAIDQGFDILVNTIEFIDQEQGTDLLTAVTSPGDLTVFAPTNDAFGTLALDLGYLGDISDVSMVTTFFAENVPAQTLQSIVEYHILGSGQTAASLASLETFATLQGEDITLDGPTLVDKEPDLIDPSIISADINADNGIVHVVDRVLLPSDLAGNDASTITGIVLQSGEGFDENGSDFDMLREAVIAADLADDLNNEAADLTVFAPNDAAFVGLAQTLGFTGSSENEALTYVLDSLQLLSGGGSPIPLLESILLYHVSGESLQASQVLQAEAISTLLDLDITPDGVTLGDADPDISDPSIIATDIQAANGVVHVIDGVLLPVDTLQSDGANSVDFVIGSGEAEVIKTGADNDLISGKGGRDFIVAGSGDDVVLGGGGRDTIQTNSGNDQVKAGNGNDVVQAGAGEDFVKGGNGADKLFGRGGNDELYGNRGADHLLGNLGNDTLIGGKGADLLVGGEGEDVFVFQTNGGDDQVVDFTSGTDLLDLTDFAFANFEAIQDTLSATENGTMMTLEGSMVTLSGVDSTSLTVDDFMF